MLDLPIQQPPSFGDVIKSGNLAQLQELLALRDPNGKPVYNAADIEINWENMLHCATRAGQVAIVGYLLALKSDDGEPVFDPLELTSSDANLLHTAAFGGSLEMLQYLLSLKNASGEPLLDVSQLVPEGRTLLHCAAVSGNVALFDYVLSLKKANNEPQFDVNAEDEDQSTALHHACEVGDLAIVQRLLTLKDTNNKRVVDMNKENKTDQNALHVAVSTGHANIVDYILSIRDENNQLIIDVDALNCERKNVLEVAAESEDRPITTTLLKMGLGSSCMGNCWTNLMRSFAKNGWLEEIQYSLPLELTDDVEEIPVNDKGETFLFDAVRGGNTAIVAYLLSLTYEHPENGTVYWFDPLRRNNGGQTLLHVATQKGKFEMAQYLFSLKGKNNQAIFNFNQIDDSGNTLLHLAIMFHVEEKNAFIDFLLAQVDDNGQPVMDVNAVNHAGSDALLTAMEARKNEIAIRLLNLRSRSQGRLVNIYKKNKNGCDALLAAIKHDNYPLFQLLVSIKKDLNEGLPWPVNRFESEFLYALEHKREQMALDLLGITGADQIPLVNVNCATQADQSPLYLAFYHKLSRVLSELLKLKTTLGESLVTPQPRDYNQLFSKIRQGEVEFVQNMLNSKNANGLPLFDINYVDVNGATFLNMAARYTQVGFIHFLLKLRDCNGFHLLNINRSNVLQFFMNDPMFRQYLRERGHLEGPLQENTLQNANAHSQNVHAWWDIKTADINIRFAQTLNNENTVAEGYDNFKAYVQQQIDALTDENIDDKLYRDIIPGDYEARGNKNAVRQRAIADLRRALEFVDSTKVPDEWHKYIEPNTDGSGDTEVETALAQYLHYKDVVGLIWNVIHNVPFMTTTVLGENKDDLVKAEIQGLEQGLVHGLLRGRNYNLCAKGLTSHVIHILETINNPGFTTRAVIVAEHETRRKNAPNSDLSQDDLVALSQAVTEQLLNSAYVTPVSPSLPRFELVAPYLVNSRHYLSLMDPEDPEFEQRYGPRQLIIGYIKRYLRHHFPSGYCRTTPVQKDYKFLEENYVPILVHTLLNRCLMDLIQLKDEGEDEVQDIIKQIFSAIEQKQPLPDLSAHARSFREEWMDSYNRVRQHVIDTCKKGDKETEFQYVLLALVTKPALLANQPARTFTPNRDNAKRLRSNDDDDNDDDVDDKIQLPAKGRLKTA